RTFAEGVRFPPLDDPGGDNSPPIFVDCPETVPTGCEFPLTVRVDMSNVPKPDHLLGNFTFALRYDPSVMEYVGDGQVLSDFTGFVNPQPGVIFFNGASATGQPGNVPVFTGNFRAIGGPGENVNPVLEMRTLVSAVTFTDLSSTASIFNCGFPIQEEQLLGDVDGDGRVTSTDAAYVLAFAVNNPIPDRVLARIEAGFGNVDGNRRTNARDALIILSYDIGLPVDFPLATPVCPGANPSGGLLTEEAPAGRSALSVPLEIGLLTEGEDLLVPLTVDMTASGERLGSYQLSASWDATRYEFVELVRGTDPAFAHPNVNLTETEEGRIFLAHAAPGGGAELLTLATLRLRPLTEATDPELDLRVEDLTAAGSFRSLVPVISRNETTSADDLQLEKLDVFAVPNPFRGSTALTVRTVTAGPLQVEVFDSRGRLVETLISGERSAGSHALRWEPLAGQSPGVYLVRVRAGAQLLTRRVVLLR
ncbi:MAG: T9SS type A sorting domain-containing protein, partial [Bacteroidota bacterium]